MKLKELKKQLMKNPEFKKEYNKLSKKETKIKPVKCIRVGLIRSETWMGDNYDAISSILEDTVKEYIPGGTKIINIEVKEHCGLKRFWIYIENNTPIPTLSKSRKSKVTS